MTTRGLSGYLNINIAIITPKLLTNPLLIKKYVRTVRT